MNVLTFDESLSDSVKLAEAAIVVAQAIGYAEGVLNKAGEPQEGADTLTHYAMLSGYLEASVEVLCAYLAQINAIVKPVTAPMPGLDDLGEVA
jgi:hypothetical protein